MTTTETVVEDITSEVLLDFLQRDELTDRITEAVHISRSTGNETAFLTFKRFGEDRYTYADIVVGEKHQVVPWSQNARSLYTDFFYPFFMFHTHPYGVVTPSPVSDRGTDFQITLLPVPSVLRASSESSLGAPVQFFSMILGMSDESPLAGVLYVQNYVLGSFKIHPRSHRGLPGAFKVGKHYDSTPVKLIPIAFDGGVHRVVSPEGDYRPLQASDLEIFANRGVLEHDHFPRDRE